MGDTRSHVAIVRSGDTLHISCLLPSEFFLDGLYQFLLSCTVLRHLLLALNLILFNEILHQPLLSFYLLSQLLVPALIFLQLVYQIGQTIDL